MECTASLEVDWESSEMEYCEKGSVQVAIQNTTDTLESRNQGRYGPVSSSNSEFRLVSHARILVQRQSPDTLEPGRWERWKVGRASNSKVLQK